METTEIQQNISISDIYEWLQVRVLIHFVRIRDSVYFL